MYRLGSLKQIQVESCIRIQHTAQLRLGLLSLLLFT